MMREIKTETTHLEGCRKEASAELESVALSPDDLLSGIPLQRLETGLPEVPESRDDSGIPPLLPRDTRAVRPTSPPPGGPRGPSGNDEAGCPRRPAGMQRSSAAAVAVAAVGCCCQARRNRLAAVPARPPAAGARQRTPLSERVSSDSWATEA